MSNEIIHALRVTCERSISKDYKEIFWIACSHDYEKSLFLLIFSLDRINFPHCSHLNKN